MNLNDFNTHSLKVRRFEKITESRFGKKISFDNLNVKTAIKLVNKLDETLNKIRNSSNYHDAHKDSRGLDDWLHIQLGIAHKRKLTEGEIEQAEAVLAAKDFVDRLQKMLEDVGRIINEDLPPLSDVVRDQMGQEQADSYTAAAQGALQGIQDALTSGRAEMDSAARILAGEEAAMPSMDMGMDADIDMDVDADMDLGADAELDLDAGDDFEMDDAEIGGELELGREER
jgi:hypothetical protein